MIFYRRLKPIRAMTFDLDDTLYENTSVIRRAESSLLDFLQRTYPETEKYDIKDWRKIQQGLLKTSPYLKHDMGQLRYRTLEQGLIQLGLNQKFASEGAKLGFEHFYDVRSDFKLDQKVHQTLAKLSANLPLVAITNGNVNLQQIGIDEYFTATFKASVRLAMKPAPDMFEAAKAQLKLPAEQILHVGDNLEKDVYGALAAGYQAAWYADDRPMHITAEPTLLLPHVQLNRLAELVELVL